MKTRLSIALLLIAALILCFALNAVMAGECKGKEGKEAKETETTVTIDQIPTAVAQTLQNAAGDGTIDEIEQETEDGVTIYSAEITKDGKKIDVEVAADGKLLKTEEEKNEDNDGENED